MIRNSNILNFECTHFSKLHCASLPSTAYISLCQDGITNFEPIVQIGESVTEGQIIAKNSYTNDSIHSPIPGKVVDFFEASMPNGKIEKTFSIKLDGSFSYLGKKIEKTNWMQYSPSECIMRIAEYGVLNTFDIPVSLATQIKNARQNKTETIAVRLFDEEPSYITDTFLAENYISEIAEGIKIIAKNINAKNIIFFYPQQYEKIEEVESIINHSKEYKIHYIPIKTNFYPTGYSVNLQNTASKKQIELLPTDFFIDSTTAYNLYKAIVCRIPCIEQIIYISGGALRMPACFKVRVGTPISNIIAECGGFIEEPGKIIVNGLVKGISISDFNTPITKYVKSLEFVLKKDIPDQKLNDCIRCGRCHDVCPSGLHPEKLHSVGFVNSIKKCTFCSLCNAVCPSRIPLSQNIRLLKETLNENKL